ncbi:hypothetical protein NLG97_g1305 [Lecanicillium saksenae]|uniref:Uncharacterized protein n=1 Tax=Lecanicillium saksenae TaxID=468837 RepID=A0ACC1R435_9HYPO|nr:hypothetical protein NLG97_g1305 [Lecanicillium saksenae]
MADQICFVPLEEKISILESSLACLVDIELTLQETLGSINLLLLTIAMRSHCTIHIKKGNVGDSDPADVEKGREDADGNDHADDHSVTLSACAVHMTIGDEDVHEVDSFVWDESKGNYKHLGSPRRITSWLHLKKQSRRERYRSRHNKILATVVWKGWRVVIARLGRDTWRGSHGRSLLTANSKGMKNLMKGKCAEFQIQRI